MDLRSRLGSSLGSRPFELTTLSSRLPGQNQLQL